jgi:hypothetical protein
VQLNTNASALLKDAATLRTILTYHVTPTVIASPTQLAATASMRTLSSKTLNVSTDPSLMIHGETNTAGLAAEGAGINAIAGTSTVSAPACLLSPRPCPHPPRPAPPAAVGCLARPHAPSPAPSRAPAAAPAARR